MEEEWKVEGRDWLACWEPEWGNDSKGRIMEDGMWKSKGERGRES